MLHPHAHPPHAHTPQAHPPQAHPSDETLLAYAAGHLDQGSALLVKAHIAMCPACAKAVRGFAAVGGALLEDLPLASCSDDLFERCLSRIDARAPSPKSTIRSFDFGCEVPAPLQNLDISPWRWFGPGVRKATIKGFETSGTRLSVLRLGAGRAVPQHGHSGRELTLVLKGSYSDGKSRYCAGDLAEEDASSDHKPVVDSDGECICIIGLEGQMRFKGLDRLLQPFMRL